MNNRRPHNNQRSRPRPPSQQQQQHQQQQQQQQHRSDRQQNQQQSIGQPLSEPTFIQGISQPRQQQQQQQHGVGTTNEPNEDAYRSSPASTSYHSSCSRPDRGMYQKTFNAPQQQQKTTMTTNQPSNHPQQQMQASQQMQHHQQPYSLDPHMPQYVKSEEDIEADSLYSDVQCSLLRGIDSTYYMPLSEHVLYSSYESYDNIMIDQRKTLNEMMSALSECSGRPLFPPNYMSGPSAPLTYQVDDSRNRIEFSQIENLRDKYDTIHEFSEQMFDRIGQNLDDAAGLTSRNAQLVQATLEAAGQNKLLPTTSSQLSNKQTMSRAQQISANEILSSSSSSSSLTRPSETYSPASFTNPYAQHEQDTQPQRYNEPKNANWNNRNPRNNQQVNVVQSNYTQNQVRAPYGGYLGKQQYGSPNQRFAMLENKNIPRPQDQFNYKIDNSYRPFEPIIKSKPNASVPLKLVLQHDDQGYESYEHPYAYEIQQFQVSSDLLGFREPIEPPDLDSTPITKVETIEELETMCAHIESQEEFAVDVEHHSYRSYQGLTCLLQISTRTQDFVIDAIKLRTELHRLNKSFTDPNIVKVFHGADCDILWLQRDFGVYVVNLFDTSRAAKLMKFAHLSLAFLMKHYCNVDPDKSYQLADWRERPLPLPMLQYARSDTHYLLYIYDRLRNDLMNKENQNKGEGKESLRSVFQRGKEICLKRYEKPPFSEKSHLSVLRKSRSPFNARQMYAFRELYAWRDAISRELDESVGYVMPNNVMIRIAQYLPNEPQGILALCNPIPPLLKKYLSDVHAIILKAKEVPIDEATNVMADNVMNVNPSLRSIDLDSVGHKQDVAHSAGLNESSVPNLLDKLYQLNCSNDDVPNARPNGRYQNDPRNAHRYTDQAPSRLYNFLDSTYNKSDGVMQANVHDTIQKHFVSPYHRYEARNE